MKIKQTVGGSCAALALISLVGCATSMASSKGQMEATVYDIHRRVVKLDNGLDGTLQQMNALVERLNQSDENIRRTLSLAEENQRKIDALQKDLSDLKSKAYGQWGLTAPRATPGVTIEAPKTTDNLTPVEITPAPMAGSDPVEAAPPPAPAPAPGAAAAPASTQDPQEHYQRAQRDYSNGDFQKAKAAFEEHLRLWPGSESASNALFWKAKCNLKLGDNQGAISDFEQLRREYSSSTKVPFAMHNQAVAYSNMGDVARASALLEEVVANYPVSPAAEQAKVDLQKLRGN
ncbi:MAG: hypothetical protein RLZZ303_405 [Candidatus Hydrogenedentota bacterium]|jgi:tol-pal system protein YbgF